MKVPDRLYQLILDYQAGKNSNTFKEILYLVDDLIVFYTNELLEKYEGLEPQEVYHLGIIALSKALKAVNVKKFSLKNFTHYLRRYFQQEVKSFLSHQFDRIDDISPEAKGYTPDFVGTIMKKLAVESIENIIKDLCKTKKLTPLDISLFRDRFIEGAKLKDLSQRYNKQEVFIKKRMQRMIKFIRKLRKRQLLLSSFPVVSREEKFAKKIKKFYLFS